MAGFLEFLSLYENEHNKEQELLDQLKSLGLSADELEDAYELAEEEGDIDEAINKKLAKAVTIIGMLASLASANIDNFGDLKSKMGGAYDPLAKSTQMAQQDAKANDALAGKLAYLLHPTLVDGDEGAYGHSFTIDAGNGPHSYSLDLGVKDGDVDLLKKIESEHGGVLNLALSKAIMGNSELVNQMKSAGMSGSDIGEMANSTIKGFLK